MRVFCCIIKFMKTKAEIIKSNIFTYFNLIFAVLAVLLILAGSYKSLTFLPVVLANIVIGIVQELRAKKILDELTMLNAPTARRVRGDQVETVPVEQLAAGDTVLFSSGDQICADAEVVSGELYVNESLLTGESVEIKKTAGERLLSGSFAVSGECRARLEKVGEDSYISKLTQKAKEMKGGEQSEMIRALDRLVKIAGIIIIPVGLALFAQQHFLADRTISESIVSMAAALIGMIPEGLYLLASVALVVSMIRLAKNGIMLHDMKCIETLARVDVLCVDKTGTITDEAMKVAGVVELGACGAAGSENAATAEDVLRGSAEEIDARLAEKIRAFIAAMPGGNITQDALNTYFKGGAAEGGAEGGTTADSAAEAGPATPDEVLPFSSANKYSAVRFGTDAYYLGAPEFIMKDDYEPLRTHTEPWSAKGLRVLLFARQTGCESLTEASAEQGGLQENQRREPLALILLENHIRDNAPEVFGYFKDQGVQIKVISGDNPLTVSRVAMQAGIEGAENCVDAQTLKTEEDVRAAAEKYTVFGRVVPDQKKILVEALQAAGHTVGMTGDGVNDVLALKAADCSVAMASGAGAAVHVSKMVLLDSDFAAMPHAVLEGRRVVNNIQRSASLFLVKNIFSLIAALFALVFAMRYPLVPTQVTLVAAFTIGIPGFFLALAPSKERIKGDFMKNVLAKALPAGITDALAIIAVSLIGRGMGLDPKEISTVCAVLMAVIGTMILVKICLPLNAMRIGLVAACAAGIVLACLILGPLFEMHPIHGNSVWLLLGAAAASLPVLTLLVKIFEKK